MRCRLSSKPSGDRFFARFGPDGFVGYGGMMETEARDALRLWNSVMTGGVYSLLVRKFLLGLLRARALCFEP
jgi:hypothetical protein